MHKKMSLKKFSSRKDLQAHSCFLAGAGRVEPPITESKSVALPLGDAPMKSDSIGFQTKKMGRVVGLEPTRNGATIRPPPPRHIFPVTGISPYDVFYCTIERNIRQIVFRKIFSSITCHKKILLQYIKRFIKGKRASHPRCRGWGALSPPQELWLLFTPDPNLSPSSAPLYVV